MFNHLIFDFFKSFSIIHPYFSDKYYFNSYCLYERNRYCKLTNVNKIKYKIIIKFKSY